MKPLWRVLADGLIHQAEQLPKDSQGRHYLREAAAALLEADMALEREESPQLRSILQRQREG